MTLPPIPPIIITTTHMQSTFLSNPPESSSQPEGEQTKIDKVKKAMSSKDAEEESIKSNFDDETTHVPGSMKIEEEAKVEAARREGEIRKEKLIDLLGEWREVVTACPNKKGKGWTSIYKQIQERIDYLHTTEAELGINLDRPLSEQDPLDRLNDLANKKRKHDDFIHDFFRANKRLKQDFVTTEDFRDFSNTMLHIVQEIFFRLHQGPGLDDHARTFSSLLLVLRRLGSIFTSVYAAVQKLKKDSWKELQFSLVDNSKLNVDFQDSLDDEEDARRSQEYMDDLEEEYQARALLAKSKRFFKKGFQRFSGAKYKPELRPTKNIEAKYNKVKAKLALLSSSASASKSSMVLMALVDDNDAVSKKGARNGECSNMVNQCISEQIPTQKKRILGADQLIEVSSSSGKKRLAKGFIFPNHDIGIILPAESQRNTIDPLVAVTDSSATDYDSADESSVCSTPIPPLEKLVGAEPIYGPKTIKSILKSNSTFKAEALKGVIINEPSSAHVKGNKSALASKANLAHAGKLKNMKTEDDPPLTIVMKELNELKLKISKNQSSYSRNNNSQKCEGTDHRTCDNAEYISTINMSQHLIGQGGSSSRFRTPRPSKHFFPPCIHYGFSDHLSDDCVNYPICDIYGIVKHVVAQFIPQLITTTLSGLEKCDIKKPIWYLASGCSRHMTGVKSSLHKYEKQPRPKVVFGDDSHAQLKVTVLSNVMFDEKRGTIFNSNKEVVKIAPRVRDVYILDMTSSAQESCFFAKASENLNWLWHKRLAH
ncbi:hypothetical protein Tco_1237181 [Tanacetum coccineum]